jgi:hypothetical protein
LRHKAVLAALRRDADVVAVSGDAWQSALIRRAGERGLMDGAMVALALMNRSVLRLDGPKPQRLDFLVSEAGRATVQLTGPAGVWLEAALVAPDGGRRVVARGRRTLALDLELPDAVLARDGKTGWRLEVTREGEGKAEVQVMHALPRALKGITFADRPGVGRFFAFRRLDVELELPRLTLSLRPEASTEVEAGAGSTIERALTGGTSSKLRHCGGGVDGRRARAGEPDVGGGADAGLGGG